MNDPVSGLTASRIAELNKSLVTDHNKPSVRIGRSISFDQDLLERLDTKCRALNVHRSEVIRRLVQVWLEDPAQVKEPTADTAAQPSSEDSATGDQKYLQDVAKEWPNRLPEWRDKTASYIAKKLGSQGTEFLHSLNVHTDPTTTSPPKEGSPQ